MDPNVSIGRHQGSSLERIKRSSVGFEDQIKFSESQRLSFERSERFALPETESHSGERSIKPPDFSMKLYRSLSDPRRKERKTRSNLDAPRRLSERKKWTGIFLPNVAHEGAQKREESPKFIRSYRPPGALDSQLMFLKAGKNLPRGPYKNPKPHDFRPLGEDLPEVVTTQERDPGNLHFKLKHLDITRTSRSESNSSSRDTEAKMDTHKPAEPGWDAKLVLPRLPRPPESASHTRHRRRRDAYGAFLDRVEEKLSRS